MRLVLGCRPAWFDSLLEEKRNGPSALNDLEGLVLPVYGVLTVMVARKRQMEVEETGWCYNEH